MIMTQEEKPKETGRRDEELDVAMAVEKTQNIMRKIIGNLQQKEFRLENVKQNGDNTKYIVICSIVPDYGKERDYYFIKIDVVSGKQVSPMGIGKQMSDGSFEFKEIPIKPEWTI